MKNIILILILMSLVSCAEDDSMGLESGLPVFDIDLLVKNLEDGLTGQTMGYAFTVGRDGQFHASRAGGYARHPLDYPPDMEGGISMTPQRRINIASVSKFIGAVALMHVLEDKGIDPDQPIRSYLPESWRDQMHADHWEASSSYVITFRRLLRMETALQFPSGANWSPGRMSTVAEMLQALQMPAVSARWGDYQNGNFCLIRVLIGEIEFKLSESLPDYPQVLADRYMAFLNAQLFNPMGINNVSGGYVDQQFPPMSYEGPEIAGHSVDACTGYFGLAATDNTINNAGSGGLRLSSEQMNAFLAYFMHSPQTFGLTPEMQQYILIHYLGLTSTPNYENPAHGKTPYYAKAGAFTAWDGTCVQAGRAHRSCVMIFEETGVEVGLITNSPYAVCDSIQSAYDHAWK